MTPRRPAETRAGATPGLGDQESWRGSELTVSTLAALIRNGDFVLTAELNPPKSASAQVVRQRVGVLKGFVDAVNITDSNRAVVAMAALPAALLVRDAGVEPILQVTGRDRNRIAIQADLLGASALGLPNVVFMSGDDPKSGNHPDAVHVKDLDGTSLVRMAATLRDGHFLNGDELKQPPDYFIGATAAPFATPMSKDIEKTREKIAAGAQFLQTQPIFDLPTFTRWLAQIRKTSRDVAIIAGVLVLRSADQAAWMAKIPGVAIGDATLARMRGAADGEAEGIGIAIETLNALRATPGVSGAHLYAIEWPEAIPVVVERAGLLPRPRA